MAKVTVIGTFGIKPGRMDEYISAQKALATTRRPDVSQSAGRPGRAGQSV